MKTRSTQLVLAGCVAIGFFVLAISASAEDSKRAQAPVDSVDAAARTITLDEEVYHVPTSCRISRESGTRIALSDLRTTAQQDSPIVLMSEVDYVRYEAIKKRRTWEMVELIVLDRAPR